MDDVPGEVVVAPGDVYFLAGDGVAAIRIRRRPCGERADIAARLGLGQVHRAGPVAGDKFRKVYLFLFVGAVRQQGLDRAIGQHRAEAERHVGRMENLHDAEGQGTRQPLAAPRFGRRKAHPPALPESFIRSLEAIGGDDPFIAQPGALRIACRVQRCQHVAGEFAGFFQDRADNIGVIRPQAGKPRQLSDLRYLLERELNFLDWGVVGHQNSVSWIGVMRGR